MSGNVVPLRPKREPADLTTLSFVKEYWVRELGKRQGHRFRCYWAVSPSGDYTADCNEGRRLALEFLKFSQTWAIAGSATLGVICRDMPPEHSGLEVGFWSAIGLAAVAGAGTARLIAAAEAEAMVN